MQEMTPPRHDNTWWKIKRKSRLWRLTVGCITYCWCGIHDVLWTYVETRKGKSREKRKPEETPVISDKGQKKEKRWGVGQERTWKKLKRLIRREAEMSGKIKQKVDQETRQKRRVWWKCFVSMTGKQKEKQPAFKMKGRESEWDNKRIKKKI